MSDRATGDGADGHLGDWDWEWPEISDARPAITRRSGAGLAGVVLVAAGFLLGGGIAGAVGAVIAIAAWLVLPVAYAVAAGAVVAVAVVPAGAPVALGLAGAGFAIQLLDAARSEVPPLAASVGFLAACGLLLGVAGIALAGGAGLATAAVAVGATGTGLVYAVHRYELVALGLVEDGDLSATVPGAGASTEGST